ncbi:MAG: 23S rRNA (adenine(2503)-C(2))-methyltransferase RlmN [Deltaproteobacteria bacterium]|nr:23S rRNA (adenine(2503)-C(2))-methyltransferase RlmN [Deltaproteobacteria bacterium]
MKINLKNLGITELKEALEGLGLKGYRADEVRKWLYQKQVSSFADMTNVSKDNRELLASKFEMPRLSVKKVQVSEDGTRKYLIELPDGKAVESVLIPSEEANKPALPVVSAGVRGACEARRPEGPSTGSAPRSNRLTLCVSSQVGCAMDCHFCLTATMGFLRNLSVFEIVEQVAVVIRESGERMSNLVFMGMGEPLANTGNLYKALEILLDPLGFNFSRQHITVSTSGLAPQIEKFGDNTPVKLAISLNATTDEVRDQIMPINKKYPLERLLDSLKKMHLPKRNRITFEYVMLHGVNDTIDDAKRLVGILSTMKAKINLIPFNPFPGSPYKRPPDDWVLKFQKVLLDKGYVANIRKSRGRDILGACGQLATETS